MKILKKIFKVNLFLIISFFICLVGLYTYAYLSPPLEISSIGKIYLYDNKNTLIETGSSGAEWISLKEIPDNFKNAMISVEDKNFYKHKGFDYLRIVKAMLLNIKNKAIVQGASTISQQYIKNMYLDFDKTWSRKIEEAFLTLELEVHYDKNYILEGYLNTINYGQGNYGIKKASKYYFNKDPKDLTLEEAIMLAGIPKNPSNFNPISSYENCIKRAKVVAKTMYDNKYIDKNTYDNLFKNPIEIYGQKNNTNSNMVMYYEDAVYNELKNINSIPTSLIKSGGLKIYTNLDMETQTDLENNIKNYVSDEEMQIASVIVNPENGKVISLVGGTNYSKSQYNRAISSKRQVGSTMKPFLYYAALENGFTSASTFLSEETTFNFENSPKYSPSNYNNTYAHKEISMAAAIAYSDNIYAVKTHLFLGEDTLIKTANTCGIKANLKENPSLALGTSELNMLDFATGYTTLASNGYKKDLYFIEKVEDLNGNVLYEHKNKEKLVLNQNNLYILNELLTNTTNASFKDYTVPTGLSIANKLNHKYALKTGTTKTDYWTVGYNKKALMLVWMGYDDARETNSNISGEAKNIWASTIENYEKNVSDEWYEQPKNVIATIRDPVTGNEVKNKEKNTLYYFVKGSENNKEAHVIKQIEEE